VRFFGQLKARLWQFIYGPVFFSSLDDVELGIVGRTELLFTVLRLVKGQREDVEPGFQFLAASDFVGGERCGREKTRDLVLGRRLLDGVGEKEQAGFLVMGLPGI
jgi:hypothetical protein